MVELIYGPNVVISPLTNRPLADGEKEFKMPPFQCTLCNIKLNTPVFALQHFLKGHSSMNKKLNNQNKTNPLNTNIDQQAPRPRRGAFECVPCNMTFTSEITQRHHLTGRKHLLNTNKANDDTTEEESVPLVCKVCDVMFNSSVSAKQHFSGKKHAMNLAEIDPTESTMPSSVVASNETDSSSDKLKSFACNVCNITLTSNIQLQQHRAGVKHKLAAGSMKKPPDWWKEQQGQLQKTNATKKPQKKQLGGETLRCETCNITLNSQVQLSQHLESSKHRDMLTHGSRGGRGGGRGGTGRGNAGWGNAGRGNISRGGSVGRGNNRGGGGVGRGNNSRGGGNSRGGAHAGGRGRGDSDQGFNGRGRGGNKRPGPGMNDSTRGNKKPRFNIYDRGFTISQNHSEYDKPWNTNFRGGGSGKITDRLQNMAGIDKNRSNQGNRNQQQNQEQFYANNQSQSSSGYMSFF